MRKRKIKFFSFFLAVVLVLQLTPMLYIHADVVDPVWVNGVDVTASGVTLPTGVSFDAATRTLTLDNANISTGFMPGGSDTFAGIISLNGNLTIELFGNNNLVDISSNVGGEKVAGICIKNGNLTLSGAGRLYVRADHQVESNSAKSIDVSGQIAVPNTAQVEYFGEYVATGGLDVATGASFIAGTTFPSSGDPGPGDPGPGPGDPQPTALYVNGVDFMVEANRDDVTGVTVDSFTEDAVTLILNEANITSPYTNGNWTYGIFSSNKDVTIILEGVNTIEIPSAPGTSPTGISINNGSLTIQGTGGTLHVYGSQNSIELINNPDALLTIQGMVVVNAYGEVRVEPFDSPDVKIWLKNMAILQNYGMDITGWDSLRVDDDAKYNPLYFEIDGQVIDDIEKTGHPAGETILASGDGWSIVAVGEENPETGEIENNINLNLIDYDGGYIICENFYGFLYFGGTNNISKNLNGFSLIMLNSDTQSWGMGGIGSQPVANLEGGIELFYGGLYGGGVNWVIGTPSLPSPKGLVGSSGNDEFSLLRNTCNIYTTAPVAQGINNILVEDLSEFNGVTTTRAFENVAEITASTSGKIDITYNDGGTKVVDDAGLLQSTFFFRSDDPTSTEPFPPSKMYRVNCSDDTYLSVQNDFFSPPDTSIAGDPVATADQKYTISDTGTRYVFQSTAPKILRIFADDDNSMVGGTLEVISLNGYNYGGYVAEVGSEVYVRVLPYAGYQYKPGTLLGEEGMEIIPTDEVGVYRFIMPDVDNLGIPLSCEFEPSNNIISLDSQLVSDTDISLPDGIVSMGNARFSVEDFNPDDEEEEDIEDAAGDFETGGFFDLTLDEVVTQNGSTVNVWANPLSELNAPVTIEMNLEGNLLGHNTYSVARIHNGETEILEAEYSNGTLTFETDRFSTYAILYSDSGAPSTVDNSPSTVDNSPSTGDNSPSTGDNSPSTGDNSPINGWIALMMLSGGIVILAGWQIKKMECNE